MVRRAVPIDSVRNPAGATPFVLDRAERHGEWEHRAFIDAINAHRWATVLGMRTFIRYDDVALLLKDNRRLREPGLDWLAALGITDGPLVDWYGLIMFAMKERCTGGSVLS